MDNNQINNQNINNQVNNNNVEKENEKKGRGMFYGIIAVAIFIIMAVGATYAYFTATTNSMDSAVRTGSTTLQLQYISYGEAWMNNDLIPANTNVAEYSFENQSDITEKNAETKANFLCKDDYGNSICSVYVFQVKNTAVSPQSVALDLASTANEFKSLHAMSYEVSLPQDPTNYNNTTGEGNKNGSNDPIFKTGVEDQTENAISVTSASGGLTDTQTRILSSTEYEPIYINRNGVVKTLLKYNKTTTVDPGNGEDPVTTTELKPSIEIKVPLIETGYEELEERTVRLADNITIDGNTTKTFAIVLYILNENRDQTGDDAEKTFQGQVIVKSGDGSTGVSGIIGLETDASLQSGQTLSGTTTSGQS